MTGRLNFAYDERYMKSVDLIGKQRYNLSNLEPVFREYLSAVINLKPISIKNYLSDYRYFAGWFQTYKIPSLDPQENPKPLDYLDPQIMQEYKDFLIASQTSEKTINRRLSSLRTFCACAVAQGWMSTNPARQISNAYTQLRKKSAHNELDIFHKHLTQEKLSSGEISTTMQDIHEFLSITQSRL